MNGTTLRIAASVACLAALAAPGSAMAKAKNHRVSHKAQSVVVPHKYDAGGDGIELVAPTPGVRVNLFDPVELATSLGNSALTQLGLPPLPAVPTA
jgi:hypothetical protein